MGLVKKSALKISKPGESSFPLCSIECSRIDAFQVSPESLLYYLYCITRFCHMLSESSDWLIGIFGFQMFKGKWD